MPRPARTAACVPAGVPILTRRGWKEIDQYVDRPVEVWNGSEWSRVTPRVTGTDQPLVTVTVKNGRVLTCTPDHRFLLRTGQLVRARDLEPGMQLPRSCWPIIGGGADVSSAYAQGVYAGDGTLERGKYPTVSLYQEKRVLAADLPTTCPPREGTGTGGFSGSREDSPRTTCRLDPDCMKPKSFVPGPEWSIWSRLEFLAGLTDTDGTSRKNDLGCSIQISSKDWSFILDVQLMLNTLGVGSWVGPSKEMLRVTISGARVLTLLRLGLDVRLRDIPREQPTTDRTRIPTIESVVPRDEIADEVYCFSEPKRHLGCFNGLLTGQCDDL